MLKNDFESIESTLVSLFGWKKMQQSFKMITFKVFNISAWPGQELERSDLTTKYSCQSEGNGVGPNMTADVEVEVECTYNDDEMVKC